MRTGYHTPIRMTKMKKTGKLSANQNMKQPEIMCTLYNPEIPFLALYLDKTIIQKNKCRGLCGDPVVTSLPSKAGDPASIPSPGGSQMLWSN